MWNFAALDRSPTINRQVYFQTGVTPKASSNARKILILSPIHPRTSSHLRKHRTSVPPAKKNRTSDPSAPQILTGAPQTLPQPRPRHFPRRTLPTPKSHVIPPGTHSSTARKPRNINDLISKPETPSGELRAKLLSTCHGGTSRSPPRGLDTHTRATCAAGVEGAGRARTRTHARLEAAAGPAGPGRGAGGWRQGLAGL